jgi:hypothetical protein
MARKWILTTCRGRLAHLKESLPSWLERLPAWDPLVVCSDDPAAVEFASDAVQRAGHGLVIATSQGGRFNKLECLRLGIELAAFGVEPIGQCLTVPPMPSASGGLETESFDLMALLDADTVATRPTERALARVGADDVGISESGARDDMGVLVANVGTLAKAVRMLPVGSLEGYGPEDCALRVACWTHVRRRFVRIPACWARRQHSNRLRVLNYRLSIARTFQLNDATMGKLVSQWLKPAELDQCKSDCWL